MIFSVCLPSTVSALPRSYAVATVSSLAAPRALRCALSVSCSCLAAAAGSPAPSSASPRADHAAQRLLVLRPEHLLP